MPICGVYVIVNTVNKRTYVGQSLNVSKRFKEHQYLLQHGKHHNPHLQSAWNKHGSASFTFKILEKCLETELDMKEIQYISQFDKETKLYNMREGGSNGRLSQETREKIKQANLGRPGTMLGKKLSLEARAKISEALKGRRMSEKNRKILIEYNKNRVVTDETKQKIRDARKRQIITEETKRKMSLTRNGKKLGPCSEEKKEKLRQANLGKHHAEETKRKMGQASLGHKLNENAKRKLSEERKGQNGPSAKLKNEQVYKIKTMLNQGYQGKIIASMFNVSPATICDIKHDRTWNHITVQEIRETIGAM